MLVKAIKDVVGYGPMVRIPKDRKCIVYSIDHSNAGIEYSVIPFELKLESEEYDPLFFKSEEFEILEDRISHSWTGKSVMLGNIMHTYTSFPEWFKNDFFIRANDWDLNEDDYLIVKKYKKIYESMYADYRQKEKNNVDLIHKDIESYEKYIEASERFILEVKTIGYEILPYKNTKIEAMLRLAKNGEVIRSVYWKIPTVIATKARNEETRTFEFSLDEGFNSWKKCLDELLILSRNEYIASSI